MPKLRHPGVYITEIPAPAHAIKPVPSAIPAFIGYTQTAADLTGKDLTLTPVKITNVSEYAAFFGKSAAEPLHLSLLSDNGNIGLKHSSPRLPRQLMWYAMQLFFENGGQACYVVSVGNYTSPVTLSMLIDAIQTLEQTDEVTLVLAPESVLLPHKDYEQLVSYILTHCSKQGNRFAVLDLPDGDKLFSLQALDNHRRYLGLQHLNFGACYYPYLETSQSITMAAGYDNVTLSLDNKSTTTLTALKQTYPHAFERVKAILLDLPVTIPPSAAVAGAMVSTDNDRGVWNAPANVALYGVRAPVIEINDAENEYFNVDEITGKSINVIRTFSQRGIRIWGARTLAGNDNEWRYVSTRRFASMVRVSVTKSLSWTVFEANNANTWARIKGAVEGFLTQLWRVGAMPATKPEDAFYAGCGLGVTMTTSDIQLGVINVEIGMAVIRPAEFIVIRLQLVTLQP